jgi:hypothetical protein
MTLVFVFLSGNETSLQIAPTTNAAAAERSRNLRSPQKGRSRAEHQREIQALGALDYS